MHDLSRTPWFFLSSEMQNKFSVTDRFLSATGTSKWNQKHKFSTTSTIPWQKRQVTNSCVLVFSLSRSSRGCKCSCGNRRVAIRRLVACQLLHPLLLVEVRALYYSLLSFQPNLSLTVFFGFFCLAVANKNGHNPFFFCKGIWTNLAACIAW